MKLRVPKISTIIQNLIAVLAVWIAYSVYDNSINNQFEILALKYKPILSIVNKPYVVSPGDSTIPYKFPRLRNDLPKYGLWGIDKGPIGTSPFVTIITVTCLEKNFVLKDIIPLNSFSGNIDIVNMLKDDDQRIELLKNFKHPFFQYNEIRSGDTSSFLIVHALNQENTKEINLHYLFLYQAENNVLYYTYYWIKYLSSTNQYLNKEDELMFNSRYHFMEDNSYSSYLDQKLSNKILKYVDKQ